MQTYQYKTISTIMMREFGTQMEKNDIYIDTRKDKIIYPRPYFSSEMWKRQREESNVCVFEPVRIYPRKFLVSLSRSLCLPRSFSLTLLLSDSHAYL